MRITMIAGKCCVKNSARPAKVYGPHDGWFEVPDATGAKLVAEGKARAEVKAAAVAAVPEMPEEAIGDGIDFDSLSRAQLIELAGQIGADITGLKSKADIKRAVAEALEAGEEAGSAEAMVE